MCTAAKLKSDNTSTDSDNHVLSTTVFARVQMSTPDGTTIRGIDVRPAVGRHS